MTELEMKGLELSIMKAETAMAELEYKILERQEDIKRLENHIELQKKVISDAREKINQAKGK